MTTSDLIEKLRQADPGGDAVVKIFNADSAQFEPVTGMVYGGDEDVIELHSDDIS